METRGTRHTAPMVAVIFQPATEVLAKHKVVGSKPITRSSEFPNKIKLFPVGPLVALEVVGHASNVEHQVKLDGVRHATALSCGRRPLLARRTFIVT